MNPEPTHINADLVIIGAGLAGLVAAITAQSSLSRIILISKGKIFASGSSFKNRNDCWGITYAGNEQEGNLLFDRINEISKGTNASSLSKILVEESHQAFQCLQDWGVRFRQDHTGRLMRVHPCFCDFPLAAIIEDVRQCGKMLAARLAGSVVRPLSYTCVQAINHTAEGRFAVGAITTGSAIRIEAPAVLLATGGNGASFTPHIVEEGLTGDGYSLLEKAGLQLSNMQYQQRVWEDIDPGASRFSISAFFDGRHLFQTAAGERIDFPPSDKNLVASRRLHVPISNLLEDKEFDDLLLRQVTGDPSSAIHVYSKQTGRLTNRIYPHVQASNGGIQIGPNGETGIKGLFAAGEVTTGMHGGDRVGGMMIASCMVFGRRAAIAACEYLK